MFVLISTRAYQPLTTRIPPSPPLPFFTHARLRTPRMQPRNAQGGLAVNVEEIRAAFADFDVDQKMCLERAELTALFKILFPEENHKEVRSGRGA